MVKPDTFVTVHDKHGEAHTFSPDDDLPKWALDKIDNPNVLPQSDRSPSTGSTPVQRSRDHSADSR